MDISSSVLTEISYELQLRKHILIYKYLKSDSHILSMSTKHVKDHSKFLGPHIVFLHLAKGLICSPAQWTDFLKVIELLLQIALISN